MDSVLTPYDILDLSPNSTVHEIKGRYRQLVLMYHPDKCSSSILKFMSEDYFSKIQEAYKEIMRTRRTDDMPTDTIDYDIEDSLQQEMDHELREILDMGTIDNNNFNVEIQEQDAKTFNAIFNQRFEEVNTAFKDLRINETKGHSSFNHLLTNPNTIVQQYTPPQYNANITIPQKTPPIINTDIVQSIIGYNSPVKPFGSCSNFSSFTLTTTNDSPFSMNSGKNSLDEGDLGAVYRSQPIKEAKDPVQSTEELLQEKKEERSHDYVLPTKEEATKALEEDKEKNALLYEKEKVQYESLWQRAVTASKKLLGY